VNRTLADLDQALENVYGIRAQIGARLNGIDNQKDNNENLILQVDESLSVLNDLDYAEAISRLKRQLVGLQAAQESYAKVEGLSLFDYIP
jgi:flagellar hook-associated protein 3 FlgL